MEMSKHNRHSQWSWSRRSGKKVVKLGCNTPSNRIEACHRVSKKCDNHLEFFTQEVLLTASFTAKKDLHKIKMEDVDLPGQNKLF